MDADGTLHAAYPGMLQAQESDSITNAVKPKNVTVLDMLHCQGCCKTQGTDSVWEAPKSRKLTMSGMLLRLRH